MALSFLYLAFVRILQSVGGIRPGTAWRPVTPGVPSGESPVEGSGGGASGAVG